MSIFNLIGASGEDVGHSEYIVETGTVQRYSTTLLNITLNKITNVVAFVVYADDGWDTSLTNWGFFPTDGTNLTSTISGRSAASCASRPFSLNGNVLSVYSQSSSYPWQKGRDYRYYVVGLGSSSGRCSSGNIEYHEVSVSSDSSAIGMYTSFNSLSEISKVVLSANYHASSASDITGPAVLSYTYLVDYSDAYYCVVNLSNKGRTSYSASSSYAVTFNTSNKRLVINMPNYFKAGVTYCVTIIGK